MKIVSIVFENESDRINLYNLSEFFMYFRMICRASSILVPLSEQTEGIQPEKFFSNMPDMINSLSGVQRDYCFAKAENENDVYISKIHMQSPIQLDLTGPMWILTIGLFLCGGSVEYDPTKQTIKMKLNSLLECVAKLKTAFSKNNYLQPSFGLRKQNIKLNKVELDALFQQDPSTRNNGGFQRFLVDLQLKTNKQNGKLILSDLDLEKILKYKSNPKKGGWQNRFKKIFARHF
jgi:hypothetical protein